MQEIKYTINPYGAYLTEVVPSKSDTVIFKLEGEDDALLKIGEKIILNGVNNVRAGAPVQEISHEEAKKAFEGKM